MIGFRLGDLWVKKLTDGKSRTIRVDCHSTKPEQIQLFKNLFEPYSKVIITKHKAGTGSAGRSKDTLKARVYLDLSFDFLLPKQDEIEKWIASDNRCFWAFVAGYTDAEGCFAVNKSNNRPGFHLQSYDKNILCHIHDKLKQFSIMTPFPSKARSLNNGRKLIWRFSVFRKNSLKSLIMNLYPVLRHSKRRKDMQRVWEMVKND